LRSKFIAAQQ